MLRTTSDPCSPAGAKPVVVLQCSSGRVTVPRSKEGKKGLEQWLGSYIRDHHLGQRKKKLQIGCSHKQAEAKGSHLSPAVPYPVAQPQPLTAFSKVDNRIPPRHHLLTETSRQHRFMPGTPSASALLPDLGESEKAWKAGGMEHDCSAEFS